MVVDVETTGLFPGFDRIIEIGAVAIEGGCIVDEFGTLICVARNIPRHVQCIHGINNRMLIGKPKSEEVIPQLAEFISKSALVCHNAKFDLGFLRQEFMLCGIRLNNLHHCTLTIARQRFPRLPNHRLETVYRHLFGALPKGIDRHRALDDARLTAKIWMALVG